MLKITNLQKTFNPGTINAKTALNGLNLTLENADLCGELSTRSVSGIRSCLQRYKKAVAFNTTAFYAFISVGE